MSTDAIVMLKDDHRELRRTFAAFEQAGAGAVKTRQGLVDRMIEQLTVHTYLENEVLYPRVLELLPDLEAEILESFEEHHVADLLLAELATMTAEDERFAAKVSVLMENVRHHLTEEEENWFPQVREALGRRTLQEIGQEMADLRPSAPTRPSRPSALRKAVDAVVP